MVFEYKQTLLYFRAVQPVCRTRPSLSPWLEGGGKGGLSVYFPCSQFTELARPILSSSSPLSLIWAPDSIFPGEFFPSFGKRLFFRVSPPPCNDLQFQEENVVEPQYVDGGIGKNFYEIIRSSREFVKGMGSGRGEERERGRMGWGDLLCGGNGCFATREFPLALFLIKIHQSRNMLYRTSL